MGHKLAEGFLAAYLKMEIVIANSNFVRCKTNELIRQNTRLVGIERERSAKKLQLVLVYLPRFLLFFKFSFFFSLLLFAKSQSSLSIVVSDVQSQ